MGEDYITTEEAARRSGLGINSIRRLLRSGMIVGFREGTQWWVLAKSLEAYANPTTGFLLDLPGPKLYLKRRDREPDDSQE